MYHHYVLDETAQGVKVCAVPGSKWMNDTPFSWTLLPREDFVSKISDQRLLEMGESDD